MSFLDSIDKSFDTSLNLVDKIIHRAGAQVTGLLNPDHNHDEAKEKAADAARQMIRDSHRFDSFAGQRSGNAIKWHIDGHDYMWAVSHIIDSAKESIFILDWWLTPELHLRRPPAYFPEWRLDRLLQKKAEQGVKVYVVVYKEIPEVLSLDSHHAKVTLEKLHPNIKCMRHPDHIGAEDTVEFWSHHEKVVLVDNKHAAIGGLDLCYGRWDTHTHPLADVHPTDLFKTLFPGQEYNNGRILDFNQVENYVSNKLSIREYARMPWHDVHMTLTGSVVLDIAQHFIERWNMIKQRKYSQDNTYIFLAFPHEPMHAPNEPITYHPDRQQWEELGHKYPQPWHGPNAGSHHRNPGTCKVQVVRSVSDWSHGVLTEHSIQNAYIQLINEAHHYIYIENQFFISSTRTGDVVTNLIAKALLERILRAANEGQKFKVVVVIPEVPGLAGDIKSESSIKTVMGAQYRTINRGGHSIYEGIRKAGYDPMDYIRFYHLRTYDRINAPKGYIDTIENYSGVTFVGAQVALAKQWVAGDTITDQKEIVLGIPVDRDIFVPDDDKLKPKPATVKASIPTDGEAALEAVEVFQRGSYGQQSNETVSDNVAQHRLSANSSLLDEPWLGTEQEELDSYVSELIYIHSKVMVVDDRRVIMGSANLNDRSQKGNGDSEIALVVEDDDMIESYMNGQPYSASRFAATFRRQIYKEHLGLIPPQNADDPRSVVTNAMRPSPTPNDDTTQSHQDRLVADPLSHATDSLWTTTARQNREIYTEVFRELPTNLVQNWGTYTKYRSKGKTNHVAEGVPLDRVKNRLSAVHGSLIEMPLDFLIEEKDLVAGLQWTDLDPSLPIYV